MAPHNQTETEKLGRQSCQRAMNVLPTKRNIFLWLITPRCCSRPVDVSQPCWWYDLEGRKMTGDRLFVGCILLGPLNSTSCLSFKCKIIADVFLLYFNVPADSFFCSTHHCRQGVSDNLVPGHRQTHLAHHMCSSCILREMLPNPRVGHCKAAEQKKWAPSRLVVRGGVN